MAKVSKLFGGMESRRILRHSDRQMRMVSGKGWNQILAESMNLAQGTIKVHMLQCAKGNPSPRFAEGVKTYARQLATPKSEICYIHNESMLVSSKGHVNTASATESTGADGAATTSASDDDDDGGGDGDPDSDRRTNTRNTSKTRVAGSNQKAARAVNQGKTRPSAPDRNPTECPMANDSKFSLGSETPTRPRASRPLAAQVSPHIPSTGFVRLPQVLAVIPVGKSTWWAGCKSGRFPSPVHLSPGITVWRAEDIHALIQSAA